MKLTKKNFLKHFDKGEVFYIAGQTNVDKCYPIKTKEYGEGTYFTDSSAFTIGNKVFSFSRTHLHISFYMCDVLDNGRVFTNYKEACLEMRQLFIELVGYYNRHEFKEFPIMIVKRKKK